MEEQFFFSNGTVAMFTDENVCNSLAFRVLIVDVFAIDEHHDIGILLDRTALAEIGQHRNRRFSGLDGATELRECNHRDIQLFRQRLA